MVSNLLKNRKTRRALKAVGLGSTPKEAVGTEIKNKYFKACAGAGELQYKIGQYQKELSDLNEEIRKLNLAYTEVLTQERAKQGAEAVSTSASPASPEVAEAK